MPTFLSNILGLVSGVFGVVRDIFAGKNTPAMKDRALAEKDLQLKNQIEKDTENGDISKIQDRLNH
jgi:hypothetical protein